VPPKAAPSANNKLITTAPKSTPPTTLASRYAAAGIGLARFSTSQPKPRSLASDRPMPKSEAPIAPNAP